MLAQTSEISRKLLSLLVPLFASEMIDSLNTLQPIVSLVFVDTPHEGILSMTSEKLRGTTHGDERLDSGKASMLRFLFHKSARYSTELAKES